MSFECRRRGIAIVFMAMFVLFLAGADWPQWRGPSGQGNSAESPLPTTWSSTSSNVRWKKSIPGDGLSSPTVLNGRVYLTTAYEGTIRRTSERVVAWISIGLAALFLAAVVSSCRHRSAVEGDSSIEHRPRFIEKLNRWVIVLATTAFLAVYVVCSFDLNLAGHFERLNEFPGAWHVAPSSWVPAYYFEATPGHPWATWLVSGGICLLGFGLALGCLARTMLSRCLSAMLIFALAAILFTWTPRNMSQALIPPGWRMYALAPGLLLGVWFVVSSPWLPLTPASKRAWPAALLLCVMSALMFLPANFLKPEAGQLRVVVCLDFKDGHTIWETPVVAASEERKHVGNSFATPTPCTDGKHVFADFGCVTACLDMEGNVVWTATNEHYYERREYGSGASPVMAGDLLIVIRSAEQYASGEGYRSLGASSMVAFEKETGKVRWSKEPEDLSATYATPLLLARGDKPELIVLADNLGSYDPETGERLWSYPLNITQPVPCLLADGDNIYICGGTHDDEGNKILAIHLTGTGKETQVELLWQKQRAAPEVSSPVLVNGRIYVINSGGVAKCISAATGKALWQKRLMKQARFFPSLVAGDGKVYVIDNLGQVTVLEDGEEFKILAENELEEGRSHASPALADGCFLIRIGKYLYCIGT